MESGFVNPPNSARPRVWWHWLNGNVTKDGIAKDLDWMVKVGIGGLQNFDVDLNTPVLVRDRLAYMTPQWKDAFRFAVGEAERRGLEFAIAASPGWSETGGPWVKPEDGLKKIVWSETPVRGGTRFKGKLTPLPAVTGAYLDLPFSDPMASLGAGGSHAVPVHSGEFAAFAVPAVHARLAAPAATDSAGNRLDVEALWDDSLATAIEVPRGTADAPTAITLRYANPVTVRTATLFVPGTAAIFSGATVAPTLESSNDGQTWTKVGAIPATQVPTTISFAPHTARMFRVILHPLAAPGMSIGNPAPGIVPSQALANMGRSQNEQFRVAQFRLSAEPMIDRFEAKAGFELERDYFDLPQPDPGGVGIRPQQIIDLTSRVRPDGSLDWIVPAGDWKIIRLGFSLLGTTNHPAPAEATGLEVDKFDGAAVRAYLEHYLGMYRDAAGQDLFGKNGLRAILTDSIEVGAANWTPRMVEQFRSLRGYDPTPWMPALAGVLVGSREESDRFLYDYRRTLADLMAREHYGTVAQVAHSNGLAVYGEALENRRPSLGDDMAMRRYTDVPMSALWTFPRGGQPNPSFVADMKGAASVAHVYGQNLVAAESMTSGLSYWADSPRTLKHAIDLEFVTGINRLVIHTSVHSPDEAGEPGLSLMIFGQFFNRHEAWGDLAKGWIDYISRNSFMLQQGRNYADVAYFYGEEAPLTGLYGEQPVADAPRRYAYDFINADALLTALRNEGGELVSSGGARYKVLYLGGSSHQMTLPVLKRVAALVEGGATVVGRAPVASPSLADDPAEFAATVARLWPGQPIAAIGQGRVIAGTDVEAALGSVGIGPDLHFPAAQPAADLPFVHRQLPDGDSYFIVNRTGRTQELEAHFRVTGKVPQLWHAETGIVERVSYRIENGETIVPLALAEEDAVHVVFRQMARATGQTVAVKPLQMAATVSGPWTVTFQPGRSAPPSISMAALAPLDEHPDAGVRHFSGIATYSTSFVPPASWKTGDPIWIDLGEVREVAEVWINGQSVGQTWHAPYRLDVSRGIRRGPNLLEVRVGNLWVNRLIGDAQPGANKVTRTALETYQPTAPLQRSGLIGPVRLLKPGS